MSEENVPEWILKTQSTLGNLITYPRLSSRNLIRPAFRFIFDVVVEYIKRVSNMDNLFTENELDFSIYQDKTSKQDFIQKLILYLSPVTSEDLDEISVNKVLAGLEPDKTNRIFVAMYDAHERLEAHKRENGPTLIIGSDTTHPVLVKVSSITENLRAVAEQELPVILRGLAALETERNNIRANIDILAKKLST
jgi:hypothetical protein